jgi:hypothetical protein
MSLPLETVLEIIGEKCYFCPSYDIHYYHIATASLPLCPLHERVLAKYIISEVFKEECKRVE